MTTHTPQQASDFEYISKANGTCHLCTARGDVLAYDMFAPRLGMWFCALHWQELHYDLQASYLTIVEDRRPLPALIDHYRDIATILARQPDTLPRLLAADYRFVAELLVLALRRGTVAMLVRELRGNLNRRASYIHCERRNAMLQVAARTIERLEAKKP